MPQGRARLFLANHPGSGAGNVGGNSVLGDQGLAVGQGSQYREHLQLVELLPTITSDPEFCFPMAPTRIRRQLLKRLCAVLVDMTFTTEH
jgi:hypothetical protein